MSKPTNLLARLFSRGQGGPLVPQIYSRVINRPLLVEPGMAEALIDGWLRGGVEAGDGGEPRQVLEKVGHIAVVEVSGPLIARAIEAPLCGTAPVSYENLMLAFDDIEADANITHVVMRLETPGGEAAQLFDLTDRMAEMRKTKTIICMVDDYAYSGGYGLAAACSEIWLTRTGGVGSVGVVIGHKDVSEKNAREGVKWTYIHSGAMKVAGNPNEPLSEEARSFMQGESDRLYEMFTSSVANYRGLSLDAVKATDAKLYFGQNAIDAGLADHLGTFRELMVELQGGTYTRKRQAAAAAAASVEAEEVAAVELPAEPAEEGDAAGTVEADPDSEVVGAVEETQEAVAEGDAVVAADQPLAADAIAEQCQANGLASVTATAIREKWTASHMAAAVARANEVRNLCTAAGLPQLAAGYINASTGVEVVRQELASRLKTGNQVNSRLKADKPAGATASSSPYAAIYARRNAR
ncbi:S49 family peptidase [Pseudomonas sp. BN414]|uniref:S49 family peptidase n=1 Tax=Pseudomonas sp. BN414 TaxID=2567888 RepID=UPI00245458DC|nr:S49 family peptidase [Pseudomonas sp. BN414]MDH4566173.1 S49 family peptidase [Pseudomonas sp. BN414]